MNPVVSLERGRGTKEFITPRPYTYSIDSVVELTYLFRTQKSCTKLNEES